MRKSVLMVAFHFPPAAMGSGHLRTLGFARHLPESGWDPLVLSARALAYPGVAPLEAGGIPAGCVVERALAFDAGRHFAVAGKYPGWLAQPDRWSSWWPAAVRQGLRMIRKHRAQAIWSTYPIMTAHCIAHTLARKTGLPWIADFRDPLSGSLAGGNRYALASQRRWEARVLQRAARVVFTTPGALHEYSARFPDVAAAGRLQCIGNGYEEHAFAGLEVSGQCQHGMPRVLLHSGLLYPDGRDPGPFFTALARFKSSHATAAAALRVVLRASGNEGSYRHDIARLGIADLVTLAPAVGNRAALAEQVAAAGLLLFQGSRFDRQIPAKAYEYLRAGRPILALLGPAGDTAGLLRNVAGVVVAPLDDPLQIEQALPRFLQLLDRHAGTPVARADVDRWSRAHGARVLAGLLDEVAA